MSIPTLAKSNGRMLSWEEVVIEFEKEGLSFYDVINELGEKPLYDRHEVINALTSKDPS